MIGIITLHRSEGRKENLFKTIRTYGRIGRIFLQAIRFLVNHLSV